MAKYKIGITEAGDASLDLSWTDKLDKVDGAILVTKRISQGLFNHALELRDRLIIHSTTTGYRGTILEPNVPAYGENLASMFALVCNGFPIDHVVIRIDPIIPTKRGLRTAYEVFKTAMEVGFSRFRVSIIDMYPHVRDRFKDAGLPLPYGDGGFAPSREQIEAVDDMLAAARGFWRSASQSEDDDWELRIECCAEPGLRNAIRCGCVSDYDLKLFGLEPDDDMAGYQRKNCMCYSGKTELLKNKEQCQHQCLYCYWT